MNQDSQQQGKPPAFQFYADDFLAGTMVMSQAEVGAYIRLLCHQWTAGGLPDDAAKLKRLAGGPITSDVRQKFPPDTDGLLRNKRLESVRREQMEWKAKSILKAEKAAAARWGKEHARSMLQASTEHKPSSDQAMLATCPSFSSLQSSNPPSGALPPNPQSPREPDLPVELPPNFPRTLDEAKQAAGTLASPPEFIETEWNLARYRGGCDAKGQPIKSWSHYLAARQSYDKNRTAQNGHKNSNSNGFKPIVSAQTLKQMRDELKEKRVEIRESRHYRQNDPTYKTELEAVDKKIATLEAQLNEAVGIA